MVFQAQYTGARERRSTQDFCPAFGSVGTVGLPMVLCVEAALVNMPPDAVSR
jgi:hypothetical protein